MTRRQRRPDPKPWAYDWRNPDMLAITRIMVSDDKGVQRKKTMMYLPEEMTEVAANSLRESQTPDYKHDPTYNLRSTTRRTGR